LRACRNKLHGCAARRARQRKRISPGRNFKDVLHLFLSRIALTFSFLPSLVVGHFRHPTLLHMESLIPS
jgi:hypothetical protein